MHANSRQRTILLLSAAALYVAGPLAALDAESPPTLTWNRTLVSAGNEYVNGLAVDSAGNAVVVGYTDSNLFRTRVGILDAYYASYNVAGEQRWANQFGASPFRITRLEDVTLGPNGDWFGIGKVDYRRGATHYGGTDVFVQRISPAGALGFVTQLGTASSDNAQAITASSSQIFAAGDTYGALSGTNAGGNDAFIARYRTPNSTLVHEWSAQKGTDDWDVVYDTDYAGNRVFVSGETFGNFNGPNINLTDAFLLSYDTDGNFQWARQYGKSNEPETGYAVATNGTDAVYIAGLTFLGQSWQSGGAPDAFLAKYDLNGDFQWQRFYQTDVWDVHTALDLDAAGNVYVGGYTGQQSFTPSESSALVMKYSPSGDLIWKEEYNLAVNERMSALHVNPAGDKIWIAGTYAIDLDEGGVISHGYVALLEQPMPGDFNGDGVVDGADYVVWRNNGGTTAQFNEWRANFGATGATATASIAQIPEPVTMALGGAAAIWLVLAQVGWRSQRGSATARAL